MLPNECSMAVNGRMESEMAVNTLRVSITDKIDTESISSPLQKVLGKDA